MIPKIVWALVAPLWNAKTIKCKSLLVIIANSDSSHGREFDNKQGHLWDPSESSVKVAFSQNLYNGFAAASFERLISILLDREVAWFLHHCTEIDDIQFPRIFFTLSTRHGKYRRIGLTSQNRNNKLITFWGVWNTSVNLVPGFHLKNKYLCNYFSTSVWNIYIYLYYKFKILVEQTFVKLNETVTHI